MRRLLVTARARADLGLSDDHAGVDAREIVNDLGQSLTVDVSRRYGDLDAVEVTAEVDRKMAHHYGPPIAFVRERSQQPEGQEWTQRLPHNYNVNLDITWLRDDNHVDAANLPHPDVLARELAEDLLVAARELDELADALEAYDASSGT